MNENLNDYEINTIRLQAHLNEIRRRLCLRVQELDEKALLRLASYLLLEGKSHE